MIKQFTTYKIALELKKLGFDEKCPYWYVHSSFHKEGEGDLGDSFRWVRNSDHIENDGDERIWVTAPLWQQAIDWLREKHRLYIGVLPYRDDSTELCWYYTLVDDSEPMYNILLNDIDLSCSDNFNLYQNAREKAILKAIELIKSRIK